jgi:hypothetical protein
MLAALPVEHAYLTVRAQSDLARSPFLGRVPSIGLLGPQKGTHLVDTLLLEQRWVCNDFINGYGS